MMTYLVEKPTETLDELVAQIIVLCAIAQEAFEQYPRARSTKERVES